MVEVEGFFLPGDLYYDRKDHLWAKIEDGKVRIGLDMFGQKAAGNIAYIKLMPPGKKVKKGKAFGSLEAGKYVGPLKAPVSGTILMTNSRVLEQPSLVNTDPYGEGWFVIIEPENLDEDIKDLIHGEDQVRAWLESEIREYKEKGLLPEE